MLGVLRGRNTQKLLCINSKW